MGWIFLAAIEFYVEDESQLPDQVRYAIRLFDTWHTASTYPPYHADGAGNAG